MKIHTVLATKGPDVITIRPEQTVQDALGLLGQYNIGALVVVDASGAPVGILSERDIVRQAVHHHTDLFTLPVSAMMTKAVVTGSPHDDLKSVLQSMTKGHFRHLPILDDGKLVGIISIGDVVKAQMNEYQGEIDTLETRVER